MVTIVALFSFSIGVRVLFGAPNHPVSIDYHNVTVAKNGHFQLIFTNFSLWQI